MIVLIGTNCDSGKTVEVGLYDSVEAARPYVAKNGRHRTVNAARPESSSVNRGALSEWLKEAGFKPGCSVFQHWAVGSNPTRAATSFAIKEIPVSEIVSGGWFPSPSPCLGQPERGWC